MRIGNGDNENLVVIFFPGPFQLLSKPTTLLKSKATRQLLNLAVRMIPDPGFQAPIFEGSSHLTFFPMFVLFVRLPLI